MRAHPSRQTLSSRIDATQSMRVLEDALCHIRSAHVYMAVVFLASSGASLSRPMGRLLLYGPRLECIRRKLRLFHPGIDMGRLSSSADRLMSSFHPLFAANDRFLLQNCDWRLPDSVELTGRLISVVDRAFRRLEVPGNTSAMLHHPTPQHDSRRCCLSLPLVSRHEDNLDCTVHHIPQPMAASLLHHILGQ